MTYNIPEPKMPLKVRIAQAVFLVGLVYTIIQAVLWIVEKVAA